MTQRKRQPTYPKATIDEVRGMRAAGLGASEIVRVLGDRAPHRNTIANWIRDARDAAVGDQWLALEADPQVAARVLPVLADASVELPRSTLSITVEHAGWIAWLRTVAPDLPAVEAFTIARTIAGTSASEANRRIAPYLAFSPWRGPEAAARYAAAVGRLGFPPTFNSSTEPAFAAATHTKKRRPARRRAAGASDPDEEVTG